MPVTSRSTGGVSAERAQMIHDTRVDVGTDDLQIVEARHAEGDERVDHRPRLIAFRRPRFQHAGARRQVDARPDDEDAADATGRLEAFDHAETGLHAVAGFDFGVGAEAARLRTSAPPRPARASRTPSGPETPSNVRRGSRRIAGGARPAWCGGTSRGNSSDAGPRPASRPPPGTRSRGRRRPAAGWAATACRAPRRPGRPSRSAPARLAAAS